jgi:hypothetical protein
MLKVAAPKTPKVFIFSVPHLVLRTSAGLFELVTDAPTGTMIGAVA